MQITLCPKIVHPFIKFKWLIFAPGNKNILIVIDKISIYIHGGYIIFVHKR